jgi:esterase/lipase superfamily enzyme
MNFSSRGFSIGLLALTIFLSGCSGRPRGTLTPIDARAPGTSEVDMLVATTRSSLGAAPGELFTGERGGALSFADVAISIPPDGARQIGEVQWPGAGPANPYMEFVALHADILPRAEAVQRFDARVRKTPDRQVLLFVHGYNTRFEEAVYRFAQIVHDSGTSALPVLFTWPSRGKLLAYGYDHESANYSRDQLEAILQGLTKDNSVREISILAHSMGNWVTLEAVRQMAIRNRGLPQKIKNVMLAAPDVDFDVFQRQIYQIGVKPSLFTLFVSRDDEALAVSRRVWGEPRLGAINPQQEPYERDLSRDRITVVDLTDVKTGDHIGHSKFAEAPEVLRSIGSLLSSGQSLSDSQPGIGDRLGQVAAGAASAVGSAASVAVVAPFAIVDPRTRDNLSDRIEQFGSDIQATAETGANVLTKPLQ